MTHRRLFFPALGVAALLGLAAAGSATAQTPSLAPQATEITTDLGQNASAVTYWVEHSDGWHVVTTVDSVVGGETTHAVVRFSANMLPGQFQLVSVPGPAGAATPLLRIRRLGDRIEVTRLPAAS